MGTGGLSFKGYQLCDMSRAGCSQIVFQSDVGSKEAIRSRLGAVLCSLEVQEIVSPDSQPQ